MQRIHKIQGLIFILLLVLFILIHCDIFEPREARFEIISTSKEMTSYGFPYIEITVKNVGDATGFNVSCDVIAIKEESVVDSGFAYFGVGIDVSPGESIIDDAIFLELTSHDDYDKIEYVLDWLTR